MDYKMKLNEDSKNAEKMRRRGLSVCPDSLLFFEVFVGEDYHKKITFRNISINKLILRISMPYSEYFKIAHDGKLIFLAPGLSVTKVVSFSCSNDRVSDCGFPIWIDNSLFEIPIRVKLAEPCLTVIPTRLDFGTINLGGRYVSKYLQLVNASADMSSFSIDFGQNSLDLSASPRMGTLLPQSSTTVRLDLAAFIPGQHFTQFWVKGSPSTLIYVQVHVLQPYLQAIHPNTTARFTLIDFKTTYFETTRYETLLVQNKSSVSATFVVLAEIENKLMALNQVESFDPDKAIHYRNFSVEPVEGTLGPMESRIFTVWFHPKLEVPNKGWMSLQRTQEEYLCFMRVFKVDVREWMPKLSKVSVQTQQDEDMDSLNLRLCLHGSAQKPQIGVLTSKFVFEHLSVGEKVTRVIHMKNYGEAPLICKFVKVAGLEVNPPEKLIPGGKASELAFTFKPVSLGYFKGAIRFDLLSPGYSSEKTEKMVIGHLKIPINATIRNPPIRPKPSFNLGITPDIEGLEVGRFTDRVKFSDELELPRMVVLPPRTESRPWLSSDAFIAFPNDMPRSLRVRSTDRLKKTIFTGVERYRPPIEKDRAFTPNEYQKRKANETYYWDFLNKEAKKKLDSILSKDEKLYYCIKSPAEMRWYKRVGMESWLEKSKECSKKVSVDLKLQEPIPLSPKDLYNVRIMPQRLDFGQIPINVDCTRRVAVENMNVFPVHVFLYMQKDSTKRIKDGFFVVGPNKRESKDITLNVPNYGKYYSNLSFLINNSDCFDMTVAAEVVERSLTIVPKDLMITSKADDIFQVFWTPVRLVNSLYVPTSFEWKLPPGCPYRLEPMSGTVPGQRAICCALYFETTLERYGNHFITLQVEGGITSELKVSRNQEGTANIATLCQKKILPPLSVNLIHYDTAVILNSGFRDAVFSVVNPYPVDGVSISPIAGIIPSKSLFYLDLEFDMSAVQAFDFDLCMKVQFKSIVEIKYVGFVLFPKIEFSPSDLYIRKMPCYSLTTFSFKVDNVNICPVSIQFTMKEDFPQIKISENKKYNLPCVRDNDEFLIQAGNSKEFYIHFFPQNFATYEFLLPVVCNRKIGPPTLHDELTQDPMTYVKSSVGVNQIMKHIDLSFPAKLSSTRLDVSVGRGFVKTSTLKIEFTVPNAMCSCRRYLYFQNLMDRTNQVSFDTKVLSSNFFFRILHMPKDGIFKIAPKEELKLKVVYSPADETAAVSKLELPFYVKDYSSTLPYNFIQLEGTVHKPTLTVSQNLIQFLPVPVGVMCERLIFIIAKYQPKPTTLKAKLKRILGLCEDNVLEFIYPKGTIIPAFTDDENIIPVVVKFRSRKPISQQGSIMFGDGYDGTVEVHYTLCASNSVVTCYYYLLLRQEMHLKQQPQPQLLREVSSQSQTDKHSALESLRIGEWSDKDINPNLLNDLIDFPKFPSTSRETESSYKLRGIMEIIESWVFEQGFSGSFRMNIGEHLAFSRCFVVGAATRTKKPQQEFVKSIIDFLFLYVGRDIFLEYQLPMMIPEGNIERINYSLSIYRQVLKFIQVQGGNVTHIFPTFLLTYEDYYDYIADFKNRKDIKSKSVHLEEMFEELCLKSKSLPPEEFDGYNKQAWLDLFLQVHLVVVQSSIPYNPELNRCLYQRRASSSFSNKDDLMSLNDGSGISEKSNRNFSKGEKILLDWLNLCYTLSKLKYPDLCIPNRTISDIMDDLEDAVVLTVVTIYYCPYLIEEFFSDFFFDPSDRNQSHHNAALLSLAWSVIKLGLTVKPENFFHPNPVFMIIIVTHLYQVLRSYLPDQTIEFLACLTSSVTRKITLTNPNESPIGYSLKILGDYSKVFTIETSRTIIVISPKSSTRISITFSARKLTPVQATLLLCGTCLPNGYVQNIVLTLHGDPYNLLVSRDFTVIAPIMKPTFIIAKLTSPYEVEAEYEIYYADEEPKPGLLGIRPWSEEKQLKLPRALFLNCERLVVPPAGDKNPAPLSITTACFTRSVLHFWIILRNDEIGDFLVRVVLKPKVETPSLILRVPLPSGGCSGYPGSLCSSHCPRLLTVRLPSRNTRLWATVKTMLLLTLQPNGISFWEQHFETRIGLDLMKWLLGKAAKNVVKEINFIFESKVRYKVTSLSPHVQVQDFIEIEDIHSKEFVDLKVHLCCRISSDFCSEILLESEPGGQEVRLYQIRFCPGPPALSPRSEVSLQDCRKGCDLSKEVPPESCLPKGITHKTNSLQDKKKTVTDKSFTKKP